MGGTLIGQAFLFAACLACPAARADQLELRPGAPLQGRIEDGDPVFHTDDIEGLDDVKLSGPAVGKTYRLTVDKDDVYEVVLKTFTFDGFLVLHDVDFWHAASRSTLEPCELYQADDMAWVLAGHDSGDVLVTVFGVNGGRGDFELSLRPAGTPAPDDATRDRQRIEDLRRCVSKRSDLFGPQDHAVATAMRSLSCQLSLQGDRAGALAVAQQALEILEKALGPDHREVVDTMGDVASLLREQGDLASARLIAERELAIRERTAGPDRMYIAAGLISLAKVLEAEGSFSEARPLYERALALVEAERGPEHEWVADVLVLLGHMLHAQGSDAEARPLLERALRILEDNRSELGCLDALEDLASIVEAAGDLGGARKLRERVVAAFDDKFWVQSPVLAERRERLARIMMLQGEHDEALPLLQAAVSVFEQYDGPDHPDTLGAKQQLAECLLVVGRPAEAAELLKDVSRAQAAFLGASDPAQVQTRGLLASALSASGAPTEAAAVRSTIPVPVGQPPIVVFVQPEVAPGQPFVEITDREFSLSAIVTHPAGIKDIVVVQGDQSWHADLLPNALVRAADGRSARLAMRFALPRGRDETRVSIQAVATDGTESGSQELVLRYHRPAQRLFVVALGVAAYSAPGMALGSPVKDVADVIAAFRAQEGVLFSEVRVESLVDEAVSAGEVRRLRAQFLRQAGPEDTIAVFVAGHAARTVEDEYYFLTSDCTFAQPENGIDRDTLFNLVTWDQLSARRRILLLDTCFSGAVVEPGTRGEADARGATLVPARGSADRIDLEASGIYILAASTNDQLAREDKGNGYFTRAVVEGLSGAADRDGNGYVQIDELQSWVAGQVSERSGRRQIPTVPLVIGGENFVISKGR